MLNKSSPYNIGIIGAGHLGRALAKAFLKSGISAGRLRISYSGNPETLLHLQQEGLAVIISNNAAIAAECDVVFIAIRPNSTTSLTGLVFNSSTTITSCVAGCEIALLEKLLHHPVTRIMPSSPVTIDEGRAVCAIYLANEVIQPLLVAAGFTLYPLPEENLFNIFTACVCLPAAFLQLQVTGLAYNEMQIIQHFSPQFLLFEKLFRWALALTPVDITLDEKMFYIRRMATPGGITEAIVNSIARGEDFFTAFNRGIERSREIALSVNPESDPCG